jgi:predicted DCC family thiol-disulfide oxidoreductase YuxK
MNHSAITQVYFDGLCHLCSREIDHYRRQTGSSGLKFVDITSSEFDARNEGLDAAKVHRELHVRRSDGSLATGVDAFIAIWQILPKYHWLAKLAGITVVKAILGVGYRAFATIRPLLPRRKADCSTSPYCEVNHHKSDRHSKGSKT